MKILAIDGGGIRGIYAAHVLARIEESLGLRGHSDFDLIAGTSTGSIVAAAAAYGIPMQSVTQLYRERAEQIFRKNRLSGGGMFTPQYSHDALRKALLEVFGDAALRDARTRLVIPATDLGNGSVHVFKSAYDPEFTRDGSVKVVDAIVASCSAPAYFPPSQVGTYLLSDGGLWANNPSLVALTETLGRLKRPISDVRLLSIGTGTSKKFYSLKQNALPWGFFTRWGIKAFIDLILNLQADTAANVVRLLLQKQQLVRISFTSDQKLPLDDCSSINDLLTRADRDFTHASKDVALLLGKPST